MEARREAILAHHGGERLQLIADSLAAYRGRLLVDVGCGHSPDAPRFAAAFAMYVGVDTTAREGWRSRRAPAFRYLLGTAERLPLRDGIADAVLAVWVLEHLAAPDRFFQEAYRLLRPGGGLVLLAPNRWSPSGALISVLPDRPKRALKHWLTGLPENHRTYYRCNTVRRLGAMARSAGFHPVRLQTLLVPAYTLSIPFGLRWYGVERRLSRQLPQFRTAILATCRKPPNDS